MRDISFFLIISKLTIDTIFFKTRDKYLKKMYCTFIVLNPSPNFFYFIQKGIN